MSNHQKFFRLKTSKMDNKNMTAPKASATLKGVMLSLSVAWSACTGIR